VIEFHKIHYNEDANSKTNMEAKGVSLRVNLENNLRSVFDD